MSYDVPNKCRNCDADVPLGQVYCGHCGQKYATERLTLHEIGHDLLHALMHVDRSALTLVRMLLVRPGTVALNYVRGKRKRYFGPFSFLVVVVAAASAVIALTGFRAVSSDSPSVVVDFLQSHLNLLMFAEVPLIAVFSRLLDVRSRFNLAEHLVLAAYTSSVRVLFATLILIPFWYVFRPGNPAAVALASLAIWALYFGFAASQFFPGRRPLSWCRGILTAFLASASTQGLIMLVASLFLRSEA
jgi:Protein of unknown function (DUF3667)